MQKEKMPCAERLHQRWRSVLILTFGWIEEFMLLLQGRIKQVVSFSGRAVKRNGALLM